MTSHSMRPRAKARRLLQRTLCRYIPYPSPPLETTAADLQITNTGRSNKRQSSMRRYYSPPPPNTSSSVPHRRTDVKGAPAITIAEAQGWEDDPDDDGRVDDNKTLNRNKDKESHERGTSLPPPLTHSRSLTSEESQSSARKSSITFNTGPTEAVLKEHKRSLSFTKRRRTRSSPPPPR
ncbi:hypothetical protein KEM55_005339 [Ascosphaera atra]|nr:hypothetical protein KEM55_005339 [Ascosphaera atra]